jgi:hypothetical protein
MLSLYDNISLKKNGAVVNIAAAASMKLRLQKPNGGMTTRI